MTIARIPVTLTWNYGTGSPGANVWHARYDGPLAGSAQMEGILDRLRQFYVDINGLIPPQVTIRFDGEVAGLGGEEGNSAGYPTWEVQGGAAGTALSTLLCYVVGWKTGSGGRRGRGRTFIGPLGSGAADSGGIPVAAVVATLQNAARDMIDDLDNAGNGALGVYSRADDLVRDFTDAVVRREFAVLRSRRD